MVPVFPLFFSRHSLVLSVNFSIVPTSDGSNFRAWGLETTLFSPIQFGVHFPNSSDLAFKIVFFCKNIKHCLVPNKSWFKHQKKTCLQATLFSWEVPSTVLLLSSSPTPWLNSFLLWSCTQFWEISSSHSALLLLQPQSLYSTFSTNLRFLCCVRSADCQPYEFDWGKTLFPALWLLSSSFLLTVTAAPLW